MRLTQLTLTVTGLMVLTLCPIGCGGQSGESAPSPTTRRDAGTGTASETGTMENAPEDGAVELGPTVEFVGLEARIPASWQSEMPSSTMRVAQFVLPGADDAGDAELIIYDFGPGQGGSVLDNIRRWAGQVTDADGDPVPPTVVEAEVNGMAITKVEATGTYASGMPGDSVVRPNTTVINAQLIKSPDQFVFFKLLGPQETVAAHRAGFEAMLSSLSSAD